MQNDRGGLVTGDAAFTGEIVAVRRDWNLMMLPVTHACLEMPLKAFLIFS